MIRETPSAVRIEEAIVPASSPAVGRTLAALDVFTRVGLVVVAIRSEAGQFTYNPDPSTRLESGDALIVCAELDQLDALRGLLRGEGK
jgi:K+/H+ antiporter YhaU regulatory subunit KhtT